MAVKIAESHKNAIIAAYRPGENVRTFCQHHKISASTFYRWQTEQRKELQVAKTTISRVRVYQMNVELERLRIDNEIFRKSGCPIYAPLHDRLVAIFNLQEQYSVHALCRVLNVNRSTFYHHQRRKPKITIIEQEDNELRPIIKDIFDKSKERFGSRKIRYFMMEQGITVSKDRVSRLMAEMELVCKQSRLRYWNTTNRIYRYYGNKVRKKFTQEAPNMVWVSDITYINVNGKFHYVCVIIDLFSRKVIAHKLSPSIDTKLVITTFKEAFEGRRKPENLTFHSDQGFQYTSFEFRSLLRKHGVEQSFSRSGTPLDNAVAESFFACMKREELSHNRYYSLKQLEDDVNEFIDYYNGMRPHRTLNNETPNQMEEAYFSR